MHFILQKGILHVTGMSHFFFYQYILYQLKIGSYQFKLLCCFCFVFLFSMSFSSRHSLNINFVSTVDLFRKLVKTDIWHHDSFSLKKINFLKNLHAFYLSQISSTESVRVCLWEKLDRDAIHFGRNLEMACCTPWDSRRNLQYENFWMGANEVRFILVKTKHPWVGHEWCWRNASIHLPTWPQTQHRGLYKVSGRGTADLDREGSCRKTYVWQQDSVQFYIKRRTQCWMWENFCNHITPNICSP